MRASPVPEDIDMDTFADQDTPWCAPPAHIAARFYRKSNARRKSSTPTSRRSSLSSRHSHHSNLSCHGGPQSDHVAQHLRRASIIESRKARLADRAAHAERVRLRAALVKAAPRAIYREERALAAQAAREKLLAEITAKCEEEVRRAKKIAEETKEKKAAEHARLKEEMAEKFAEAARRRLVYQQNLRRPRTISQVATEARKPYAAVSKRLTEETAARVIQTCWRSRQLHRALCSFVELGLSLSGVRNLPFEAVVSRLSDECVLAATSDVLEKLTLLRSSGHEIGDRSFVRVFLTAFLICGHPLGALSNGGKEPQEQDLIAKAEALLRTFELLLAKHGRRLSQRHCTTIDVESITFLFNDFCSAFHSWKARDSTNMISIMVSQFVELDVLIQTTKDDHDGCVAEDYHQAIRQSQIQLLARLKRFAGSETALNLVRSAVRKARKQRSSSIRKPTVATTPRGSGVVGSPSTLQIKTEASAETSLLNHSATVVAAPSSFVSRLGQTMTLLPSNREIAHEMQLRGTFEVQQQPWTDAREETMHALRSSMRQTMVEGGDYAAISWTTSMAILIREKLLNLIKRAHPLYDRIDGFLDPKIIDQTCRAGMFSYNSFFETTASLIAQICSPGRDEAVKAFASDTTSDTIDRLFSLINIVDLMTLDHMNFAFRAAAPQIIEHGHEHEQAHFEQDLQENVHTLAHAKQWWHDARTSLSSANPSAAAPNGNSIYVRALTDLVLSNTPLTLDSFPETLRLDWHRLLGLRARTFKIVATASILLTTKIRLQRDRAVQWTRDAERIMLLDFTDIDASKVMGVIESSHMMPDSKKEGLLNFMTRVLPAASTAGKMAKLAEREQLLARQSGRVYRPSRDGGRAETEPGDLFTEQVASYVLKSLRDHVFARLAATSTAEKVRVTSTASEFLARVGMPEFGSEVAGLVDVLERVKRVDLKGHERWYDEIARDV